MNIYRYSSDAFATLTLSNHDVKKLIEVLDLDSDICIVRGEYLLCDRDCPSPVLLRKNEIVYFARHYYRIPFYKEVYVSNTYFGVFVLSRCIGINEWSHHFINTVDSVDFIHKHESKFHRI